MKKSIICLALLLFAGLVYTAIKTYGLYEDNLTGKIEADSASFTIKINNSNIDNSNYEFVINNLTYTGNTNVNSTKIAPGTNGYFDIAFDPSGAEVAIRYDITFDFSNITNSNLYLSNIKDATNNVNLTRTGINTYSGYITLDSVKQNSSTTIRTTMTWINNDENNTGDNSTMSLSTINIPVTILVSQYFGETLETYTG